ncbi:hypothetical protein [Photobacterium minamisatsumaniensis]|uniref:hypothetical protein n=1 Tax=Photobacterium minamisatsumaniensis TaxID=2910233 RepID=UPI003D11125B
MVSLKSVMRNAIESWRCEVTKEYIANKVAHHYYRLNLHHEPDAPRKRVLKVPGADDANNSQNFWRYSERVSAEAKANIMDLLPAILLAMPKHRACDALNIFLNPLGFSVASIGDSQSASGRDRLLAHFTKESSEALTTLLMLPENASLDQLRAAYKEVQESEGSHKPLLGYLENLMVNKAA